MIFWIASAAGVAVAYLLGATPTGYLAGRMLRGIDIREHGSRSTGATNVLRTLGKGPALVVLLVDVLKGVAAILFARWFYAWLGTPADGRRVGRLPVRARGAAGTQPLAVAGLHRRQVGGDGARRAARALLAGRPRRGFGVPARCWRSCASCRWPRCWPP